MASAQVCAQAMMNGSMTGLTAITSDMNVPLTYDGTKPTLIAVRTLLDPYQVNNIAGFTHTTQYDPDKLDLSPDESLVIFGYVAKKLLKINIDDLEKVCHEKGLDYSKVKNRMQEVEEDLNNF